MELAGLWASRQTRFGIQRRDSGRHLPEAIAGPKAPLPSDRRRHKQRPREQVPDAPPEPEVPPVDNAVVWHVDKSTFPPSEPRRYRRSRSSGVRGVSTMPSLRAATFGPSRFTQPRALGRRVSDEFAVPLCRTHHR
jgi:hypothetical protein